MSSATTTSRNQCCDKKLKKFSRVFPETDGDEIVISGMAGKFPNCRNVEEYKHKLYNKVREFVHGMHLFVNIH